MGFKGFNDCLFKIENLFEPFKFTSVGWSSSLSSSFVVDKATTEGSDDASFVTLLIVKFDFCGLILITNLLERLFLEN